MYIYALIVSSSHLRFILIMHPRIYDRVYRPVHIGLMLAAIWVISFGMMTPPLVGAWGQLGLDPPTFSCTILKKNGSSPKKMLFAVGFVLPCLVIIISYSCILYRVRKSHQNVMGHTRSAASSFDIYRTNCYIDNIPLCSHV
jgi:hypothetical protein